MIRKEDLDIMRFDMDILSKQMSRFMEKEEFMSRLSSMNSDLNIKFNDRPTLGYFKKVMSNHEKKMDAHNDSVTQKADYMKSEHS